MKKVYIQPSVHRHVLKIEGQILITTPGGKAEETHWGDNEEQNHQEETNPIAGTGGDNGFILGAPTNKRTY